MEEQMALPHTIDAEGEKNREPSPSSAETGTTCLRRAAPRTWTHKGQYRDNRTVAAWCRCPECVKVLRGPTVEYREKRSK